MCVYLFIEDLIKIVWFGCKNATVTFQFMYLHIVEKLLWALMRVIMCLWTCMVRWVADQWPFEGLFLGHTPTSPGCGSARPSLLREPLGAAPWPWRAWPGLSSPGPRVLAHLSWFVQYLLLPIFAFLFIPEQAKDLSVHWLLSKKTVSDFKGSTVQFPWNISFSPLKLNLHPWPLVSVMASRRAWPCALPPGLWPEAGQLLAAPGASHLGLLFLSFFSPTSLEMSLSLFIPLLAALKFSDMFKHILCLSVEPISSSS